MSKQFNNPGHGGGRREHGPNRDGGYRGGGGRPGGRGDQQRSAPKPADPADPCRAPYHFVPVEPELAITQPPVFHDVQQAGGDFWSGELHCTLEALTPLIAGSFQFEYANASQEVKEAFAKLVRARKGSEAAVADTKKLIEPMRLGEENGQPGRVAIPGEAIKGALRQSWQALLSAPMERVQERTYSFRPNLQTVTARNEPIRTTVPALVVSVAANGQSPRPEVSVIVLSSLGDVCYVHPDAVPHLPARVRQLLKASAQASYTSARARNELCLTRDEADVLTRSVGLSEGNILKPDGRDSAADLAGWLPVVNLNGADMSARLNAAFHKKNPDETLRTKSPQGYPLVLLRLPTSAASKKLDTRTLQTFYDSLRHLADDRAGQLRDHPLVETKDDLEAIKLRLDEYLRNGIQPGTLVFIERATFKSNEQARVVSLGHHFYHRQRYRDSIHLAAETPPLGETETPTPQQRLRAVLCPHPLEQSPMPADAAYPGAAAELTAARGLFGYVAQNRDEYDRQKPNEPLTFGIGRLRSDFKQLAGRLSINWAVEQPRSDDKRRFLNEDQSCLVPLRPLSAPKASAVEMYLTQDQVRLALRQDGGSLCTYGDTPDDPAAGELRGRKFYLHQPAAASDRECYELTRQENPDWFLGEGPNRKAAIDSEQAAIARFVSTPGTKFRFTIRFRDLRAWELGALFLVLAPDFDLFQHLLNSLELTDRLPKGLQKWMGRITEWQQRCPKGPLLAMKLGHGRPLGLGSVRIRVDAVRRIKFDRQMLPTPTEIRDEAAVAAIQKEAVEALALMLSDQPIGPNLEQWAESVLLPWLQVRRYAGRTSYDYPRGKRGDQTQGLIYEYHTNQRQTHARGRKLGRPEKGLPPGGLISLDESDEDRHNRSRGKNG